MITNAIKFFASYVSPNPMEIDYWIDLSSDLYGRKIKIFDGDNWVDWNVTKEELEDVYKELNSKFVEDAPKDGNIYGRCNGEWYIVSSQEEGIKVDDTLSIDSINPVQNKIITSEINSLKENKANVSDIPSIDNLVTTEQLQQSLDLKQPIGNYITEESDPTVPEWAKQETKPSYTSEEIGAIPVGGLKTINGESIEGAGNIQINIPSIDNLATKQEVTEQLSAKVDNNTYTTDKETFALKEELPNLEGYATESWVEQKGYLTEHQSLEDYLTKESAQSIYQPIGEYLTEIPSEYVTDTELNSKQYATTTQLSEKADLVALDNYVTVDTANNTYAKKTEIPQTYELPIATNNRLGGIKVGAGLEVNPETGVLNATGGGTADSVDWQNITSKPETFTPSAHQHVASDITDLSSKLDLKADKTEIPSLDNYVTTSVLSQHTSNTNNPHSVTKDQIGLNNVTNDQQVKRSEMGVADGVATLDSTGKIPTSQLPSYVDDVIESETYDSLPEEGESGKIYVAKDTNLVYRWSGSAYIEISASLALGETSSTAYAGDKGKATTDKINTHVSNTSNPHSVTKAQVGLSNVDNTSDLNKPISTATQEALDLKADKTQLSDMETKTNAAATYQVKGNYLTSIPAEYITETELSQKSYATQSWVSSQGFITEHQDISQLATKVEVQEGLNTKLTTTAYNQDKATFALKTEIPQNVSDLTNDAGYLTSVPSQYVTTDQLNLKADKTAISDMLTKTEASSKYQPKGTYLTTESDPTVPSWAKQSSKPTYTASEVGAIAKGGLKTINNNSLEGSGDIKTSVNVYSLLDGIINEGKCSVETFNQLKQYVLNGYWLYASENSNFLNVDISALGDKSGENTVLTIETGQFYLGDKAYMTFVLTLNNDSVEVVSYQDFQVTKKIVSSCLLYDYQPQETYSSITQADSISKAIGKLEAAIDSEIYYIPTDVLNLSRTSTKDGFINAFGGDIKNIKAMLDAASSGKMIASRYVNDSLAGNASVIPITLNQFKFAGSFVSMGFYVREDSTSGDLIFKQIEFVINSNNDILSYSIKILYPNGYYIPIDIITLSEDSTSEQISSAFGGKSGLKNLIYAIQDGNTIITKGFPEDEQYATLKEIIGTYNIQLHIQSYDIKSDDSLLINFDMRIFLGVGVAWNLYVITYDANTDTFSMTYSQLR